VTLKEQREAVRERAQQCCEYCLLPDVLPQTLRFHLEHIIAKRHGGTATMDNLAWSCQRCNERKGPNLSGIDPDTSLVVSLYHPRKEKWEDQFVWDELKIIPLTATGRTTAWLLEMNSEERLQWRTVLKGYGLL
jgi:5-methylcytosine-specific restriction endonuclease McrA